MDLVFIAPIALIIIFSLVLFLSRFITKENNINYTLLGIQLTLTGITAIILWAFAFQQSAFLLIFGVFLNFLGISITILTLIKKGK